MRLMRLVPLSLNMRRGHAVGWSGGHALSTLSSSD